MNTNHTKKIMIVEDEFVVAEDIRECLENMGYFVSSSIASGEEALERVPLEKPDLILMDIVLTGRMDGIETARKIHRDFHIPIIFITAHSDEEMLKRAKITEPYGYILKPFDDKDLYINLEMAFYKSRKEKVRRENEKKFRAFVESSNDLIMRLDRAYHFIYLNPAARKMLDLESGQHKGSSILDFIHPDDQEKTEKAFNKVLKSKKTDHPFECRILAQTGEAHNMLWNIHPLFDQSGNLIWIDTIASDITQIKRSEIELKKINKKLKESIANMKQLSGYFSICGHCKRIRDDKGHWRHVEEYIRTYSDAELIHTICLDCMKKIYPNIYHKDMEDEDIGKT